MPANIQPNVRVRAWMPAWYLVGEVPEKKGSQQTELSSSFTGTEGKGLWEKMWN